MKKLLCLLLCLSFALSVGTLIASATPGFYCGGSEEEFTPVGDIEIFWDPEASDKLFLHDGDMQDWVAAEYAPCTIGPESMISWVGGTDDYKAGSVPEGWSISAFFVADQDYLYIGLYVTDPNVYLVNDPHYYVAGDSIQFSIDFDYALSKFKEQDQELYPHMQAIFYSFGPTEAEAAPIRVMVQNIEEEGVLSEENGDGIKGTTALTDTGWCAEFAFAWNMLYKDFSRTAHVDDYVCAISETDPLDIGCALYYLDHSNDEGYVTWAAGTLGAQEAGIQPDVTWTCEDHGMRLFLPWNPDVSFNCEGIGVATTPATTEQPPEPVTEPHPETLPPEEFHTEKEETQAGLPIIDDDIIVEFRTSVLDLIPATPEQNAPKGTVVINCGSVISPAAAILASMLAIGAAWLLRKKK